MEYDVKSAFAERLKDLIEEKGLNIKNFSKEIGIADSTISDWINKKKTPMINQIPKIAFYFKVSIDYLLGYES